MDSNMVQDMPLISNGKVVAKCNNPVKLNLGENSVTFTCGLPEDHPGKHECTISWDKS